MGKSFTAFYRVKTPLHHKHIQQYNSSFLYDHFFAYKKRSQLQHDLQQDLYIVPGLYLHIFFPFNFLLNLMQAKKYWYRDAHRHTQLYNCPYTYCVLRMHALFSVTTLIVTHKHMQDPPHLTCKIFFRISKTSFPSIPYKYRNYIPVSCVVVHAT